MDNATVIGGGDIAQQTTTAANWEALANANAARIFQDRYAAWLQNSAIQKSTGLPVDPKPERPLKFHFLFTPGYGDSVTVGPDFCADYPVADPRISEVGKLDDVIGGIVPDCGGVRYNLSNKGLGEVHFAADGSVWQLAHDEKSLFASHWVCLKAA